MGRLKQQKKEQDQLAQIPFLLICIIHKSVPTVLMES